MRLHSSQRDCRKGEIANSGSLALRPRPICRRDGRKYLALRKQWCSRRNRAMERDISPSTPPFRTDNDSDDSKAKLTWPRDPGMRCSFDSQGWNRSKQLASEVGVYHHSLRRDQHLHDSRRNQLRLITDHSCIYTYSPMMFSLKSGSSRVDFAFTALGNAGPPSRPPGPP